MEGSMDTQTKLVDVSEMARILSVQKSWLYQRTHLGTIQTGVATANCAFGEEGWLYITAHTRLLRVKTLTRPK